jgi:hypothetical protein
MRYNTPPNTHARRPRKKEKLPAGASYTCGLVEASSDEDDSGDEDAPGPSLKRSRRVRPSRDSSSDSSEYSSQSSDEEDRRQKVQKIVQKMARKKAQLETQRADADHLPDLDVQEPAQDVQKCGQDAQEPGVGPVQESDAQLFLPGSYIVALYQEDWYVGQVMSKEGEPEAEGGDEYVFVTFMEKTSGGLLKWPHRSDILNVLREDVLFSCEPPAPCGASSSSRSLTYSLSRLDLRKAKNIFATKAFYPTTVSFTQYRYLFRIFESPRFPLFIWDFRVMTMVCLDGLLMTC